MSARAAPWTAAIAAAVVLVLTACSGSSAGPARLTGARIEVMATWSGSEQASFGKVLSAFERQTGVDVRYTSTGHRLPDVLKARLAAGRPPDVAIVSQPGLLTELARAGRIRRLDRATTQLVETHFPSSFLRLGSYDGHLYGVWFKAANKSLIWYDVGAFERAGVVPPHDLTGLLTLADRLAAQGVPAFAVSAKDGWTLTDWFENLYVRTAGRPAYDALATHRIAWTDPTVVRTLQLLARLLAPAHVAGGPTGALKVSFERSVQEVFARPSHAAMVAEGDFVGGVVTAQTHALLGVDADVFPFPPGPDAAPVVVGGGDAAVVLKPTPAAAAFVQYLATPAAAAVWARRGGYVSPNLDLDLSAYPDDTSRAVARQLLEAGDDFRFDLSDLQPAAFGGSDDAGLRAELKTFLVHGDAAGTAARLEAEATAAYAGTTGSP